MSRIARQHLKKRKDGRYCCRYKDKVFLSYDEEDCLRLRQEYKKRQAQNAALADRVTVERYAARWVSTYKSHLTTGPYNEHVRILRRFCAFDNYGRLLLSDITPTDIQSFYNTFAGMSRASINHMRDTVRGLFRAAVADQLINRDPTEKAKLPRGSSGSHRAITQHERDLIQRVDHPFRPCVMLMLYAGLRRGQALAIDVDRDVDFDRKTITVRQAVRFETQSQPSLVDPKTAAGVRVVPLFQPLEEALTGMHGLVAKPVTRKKEKGKKDDMWRYMSESAFSSAWSSYISSLEHEENGISKRWYGKTREQKAAAESGSLPPWVPVTIRPHDLRHSFATMIRDAGVDLKLAMLWMGHADQSMLLQIYDHPDVYRTQKARENVEKMLLNVQDGVQE